MFKQLIKKLYGFYFPITERTIDDLAREVKNLLPIERLQLQIKVLRPPQAVLMTEMEELLALRSVVEYERFTDYLKNKQYNCLVAHIHEPTPEGRLEIKGRYLELGDIYDGIKNSHERAVEKAVDEATESLS